jgi:hypothetical protein
MICVKAHEDTTVTPASAMCAPFKKPCMSFTTDNSPAIAIRLAIVDSTTSTRITTWPSSCNCARCRMWRSVERLIITAANTT